MLNLVGLTFGRLTVTSRDETRPKGDGVHSFWICQCVCGATKSVRQTALRSGDTKSCGCLHKATHVTHGMTKTPEYRAWSMMIGRCHSRTHRQFPDYGGRGIFVGDEWRNSFEAFYRDMGPRPSSRHSLDRQDNEKGYYSGNCRWATDTQQQRNRRSNHHLTHDGRTLPIAEWAAILGLPAGTLEKRISNGWSVVDALTRPRRNYPMTRG